MSLSNEMVDVLTYIEQIFWEDNKDVPTNEKIAEATRVSLSSIEGYWKNPDFRAALNARGIVFSNDADSGRALTYEQLVVANMLMNIQDRRSLREKLQQHLPNVTPALVSTWMRQPAFQNHLRKRGETLYAGADSSAYLGLVKAIDGGDLKAIQLFFEMRGIYSPRVTHDVNVQSILARVIEIISVRVGDAATIQLIAEDIESLLVSPAQAQLVQEISTGTIQTSSSVAPTNLSI